VEYTEPRSNSNLAVPDGNLLAGPSKKPVEKKAADPRDADVGSILTGQGAPKPVIQLPNSGPGVSSSPGGIGQGQIKIRSILDFVGIKASATEMGWIVNSVGKNTVAERSGVRAGDLIEAINGSPVTDGTLFSGSFMGKSVRVKRGGELVEINLK
jgi:membrane-associated protease RseP (regulator of RpoE activity)